MSTRVYVIDDEGPMRRELRHLLEAIDGVEVAGEAASGAKGLAGIRETSPDVVFLDIQMPGLSGLDLAAVLAQLPDPPFVVFVTAHDEHALEAFEADAVDYLLKPVTRERLARALDKARRRTGRPRPPAAPAAQEPAQHVPWKIPLVDGGAIVPVAPRQIVHVSSESGKVRVSTVRGEYDARSTMAELEERLEPLGFFRAHRLHLVNLEHVLEIRQAPGGGYDLVLNDPGRTLVRVSRSQVRALKERFDL